MVAVVLTNVSPSFDTCMHCTRKRRVGGGKGNIFFGSPLRLRSACQRHTWTMSLTLVLQQAVQESVPPMCSPSL